jgi:hypothetical protein
MLFKVAYTLKNGTQKVKFMTGKDEKRVREYFAFKHRRVADCVTAIKI